MMVEWCIAPCVGISRSFFLLMRLLLFILEYFYIHYQKQSKVNLGPWLFLGVVSVGLSSIVVSFRIGFLLLFFLILLDLPYLQDIRNRYFSLSWIIWFMGWFFFVFMVRENNMIQWSGALWAIICVPFIYRNKMGSADFWFLLAFGLTLGAMKMSICIFLSCLFGLGWKISTKEEDIPFISCLILGIESLICIEYLF